MGCLLMSIDGKILAAINSALNHFESSIRALSSNDEGSLLENLWHVVAELEYALFLFSITLKNDVAPKPKAEEASKKVEISKMLADANQSLRNAEMFVKNSRLLEAYESVRNVRNYALRVQKELLKRKREASKKK